MPILNVTPILTAAAVSLALGFGGGWVSNGWRLGEEIAQIKQAQSDSIAKGIQTAMAETVSMQRKKDDAIKKAESRAAANAAGAVAAGAELERLRGDLSQARADLARATDASVRVHASTLNTVFNECGAAIADMARKAQGHASDVQTLIDAWPRATK